MFYKWGNASVLAINLMQRYGNAVLEDRMYSAVLVAHGDFVQQWGYGWWDRPVSYAAPCDRRPVASPKAAAFKPLRQPGASGKRTRQTLKLHRRRG